METAEIDLEIMTMGDLRDFVAGRNKQSKPEKSQMCSAIKRTDELVGHGVLDLAANPKIILSRLEQMSPAMAGMSKQAFANLKSRLRKAFRLAEPRLKAARSRVKLNGAWKEMEARLGVRDKRSLSRFSRFAYVEGWNPEGISDVHIERFLIHLRDEAMIFDWEAVVRDTIRTWNRLADETEKWLLQRLSPPPPKRTSYWIAEKEFPWSFQSDLSALIHHLSNPIGFAGTATQKLKPATISQYHSAMIALASALVVSGIPVEEITSLATVVEADNLRKALLVIHKRAEELVTDYMSVLAARARKVAIWCELPSSELEKLDALVAEINLALPRRRGLTKKNLDLLSKLDDPRFRDLVLLLPEILLHRASTASNKGYAASDARSAMAIELLLTCGMRRANLVNLQLDVTIRKIDSGKKSCWLIEIPAEDVKNEEPLRFMLPEETAQLLEVYLNDWRPKLCPVPTTWLFPNADGEPMDGKSFADHIGRATKRELGTPITPHQFRHISAELYLRENPEGLDTISQHLAHRDRNTTRNFYARSKQREASRRYQQHFTTERKTAKIRIRKRSSAKQKKLRSTDVDYL